jgi:hypothetical protein
MYDLDPETRRNIHYAALPAKAAVAVLILFACLVVGNFAVMTVIFLLSYLFGGH